MRKISLFFLLAILSSVIVLGTVIEGSVYDFGLDLVKNAKIEINTEPKQMLIAKEGTYSFNVPQGQYEINAQYEDLAVVENITVSSEGTFTLDLILLPEFEDDLLDDTEYEIEDVTKYLEEGNRIDKTILIMLIIICFLVMIGVAYHIKRKKKKAKQQKQIMKADSEKVIEFLKKEGGRALQKDIRKHMGISEAKASLLVDELKAKAKVDKIKKGRGNIIILK